MGDQPQVRLNAPCGAGCFLTRPPGRVAVLHVVLMHLVVLGAFWHDPTARTLSDDGLNAPSGAGCFLTGRAPGGGQADTQVVMHLLVLGAFWQNNFISRDGSRHVLMHLLALGAF